MEQKQSPRSGRLRAPTGVLDAGVPEELDRRELPRKELRVVNQHVDSPGERQRCFVQLPLAVPPRADIERGMVGEVGEAGLAVAYPEAEGLAALVWYFPGQDLEMRRMRHTLGEPVKGPPLTELAGPHGEVRTRQPTGEGGDGVIVGRWKHHVDPVRGAGARSEEREPVYMVPVHMRQQNGAPEGCVAQELAHPAQAGPGVDDERRGLAVAGDGDTRGVAAAAQEPGSRRRRRATDAAEGQPHRRPGRSAMTPQNARTGNGRRQNPSECRAAFLIFSIHRAQGSGSSLARHANLR